MAENKKEMERAELHRTIWAIADDMRGAVDGWDFKAYILGMLFYWKSPVCVTPEAQVPLTLESKFRMTPIKS